MTLPYKKHEDYPQLGFIKSTESDMYFIVVDKRHELYRHKFGITNMKYDENNIINHFDIITLRPKVDLVTIKKYKFLITDNWTEKGLSVSIKDYSNIKIEGAN